MKELRLSKQTVFLILDIATLLFLFTLLITGGCGNLQGAECRYPDDCTLYQLCVNGYCKDSQGDAGVITTKETGPTEQALPSESAHQTEVSPGKETHTPTTERQQTQEQSPPDAGASTERQHEQSTTPDAPAKPDAPAMTETPPKETTPPDQPNTQCTQPNTSLVGGVFSDSDGTAPRIDKWVTFNDLNYPKPSSSYTQSDYRALLGKPVVIQGNLHNIAFHHYLPDFEKHHWPETAHVLLRYIQGNIRKSALVGYDGVSGEGMNYHFLWLSGLLRLAAALDKYKDPTNWTPPKGVRKITTIWTHDLVIPPTARIHSTITNALKLTLPDGTDSGSHDTGLQYHDGSKADQASSWGAGGLHFGYSIQKTARSYLLPAYGQIGLGAGTLDDPNLQVQSILHFSPKHSSNGHAHNDTLMMGLFGRGRNILSFPGHQNQSHGPFNKNMVVVNAEWQNKYVSDIAGRVEIFADLPGIQFTRVDASHIMHGGNPNGTGGTNMKRYRRTLVQNAVDIEKPYLLDIFEVSGGKTHSYLMRGSVVLVQNVPKTNISLRSGSMPFPNTKGATFNGVKTAVYSASKSFWVDINFTDKPKFGSRSHFPAQGEEGTLYISRVKEQWTPSGNPGAPQFTLHRAGGASLTSTFVAVHEVLDGSGNSFIQSVTKHTLNKDSIAVKVTLKNGRVDTYLVSFDGSKSMSYGGVSATATIAAHSSFKGKSDMWMVGAGQVTSGTKTLKSRQNELTGALLAVHRLEDGASANAFDTDMVLPSGYELAGQTLLLENTKKGVLSFVNSYTIDHVEKVCGKTRIYLRFDPGVALTSAGIEEVHHPWRKADSTRLRFVPSNTTVPRIVHISPNTDPSERIQPQVGRTLTNQTLSWLTIPQNTAVTYQLDNNSPQSTTTNKITLKADADVLLSVANQSGFVNGPKYKERYRIRKPSIKGKTGGSAGLVAKRYSGYTYNFSLSDPLNSYDFKRFAPDKVVPGLNFQQVPYSQVGAGSGVIVSGFINIPTTGVYRFFTRMDRAVRLKIDDDIVIEDRGMRRAAQWSAKVELERGLHKIEVHHYSKVNAHFSVKWEGPNIPYGDIPTNVFFQYIK